MSLDVGHILGGRYFIERVIGRGSMGLVYEGRDTSTDERVAIRVILPEFDNDRVAAFIENDAKVAGQLGHEHIARLHNMGFLPSGERCIVSEYVEGETLQRRMRQLGCMSELTVAQLLIQLLESLSAAHEAGVVHRDLTPLSIFIVPKKSKAGDAVKLVDFGLSRLQILIANPDASPDSIAAETESFQYLSPEQINGLRELDPRSNIYTLGVIAYEAVTGKLPFEGKDLSDLTLNILREEPTPVRDLAPESSSPFANLIAKAMARSPNARFQYAEEMYAAISNWATRAGISQPLLESGISGWRNHALEEPIVSQPAAALPTEEAVLFAPSPVPSRDEPVARPLEDWASAPDEPAVPENVPQQPKEMVPQSSTGAPVPVTQARPASSPQSSPSALTTQESTEASSPVSAGQSRAPRSGPGFGGVVVRAPQSTEPGVNPSTVAADIEPTSYRPRQITEPGISPVSSVDNRLPSSVAASPVAVPSEMSAWGDESEVPARVAFAAQPDGAVPSARVVQLEAVVPPEAVAPSDADAEVVTPRVMPQPAQDVTVPLGEVVTQPVTEATLSLPDVVSQPAVEAAVPLVEVAAQSTEVVTAPPVEVATQPRADVTAPPPEVPQPAAVVQAKPVAQTAAVVQPTPRPIVAAASDLGALGPYGTSPFRSRKPKVIAVSVAVLVLACVALALLQNKPDARQSAASEPLQSARVPIPTLATASAAPVPTAEAIPSAAAVEEKPEPSLKDSASSASRKPAPSLSDLVASTTNRAQSSASAQPIQTKAQHPLRPAQGTQTSTGATQSKQGSSSVPVPSKQGAVSAPSKQGSSKAAIGSDPYRYR